MESHHELGVLVHRILSRHTLKDFYFRSGLKTAEDEALQENPKFWELIETAKTSAKYTGKEQLKCEIRKMTQNQRCRPCFPLPRPKNVLLWGKRVLSF
jgi:hypothetical protein